ncbi:hypothetical protein J3458_001897 [Metarhizium acridum]|uniref:uncharacterized protein n=1 Tax=Metarhizium acridum TaxID=92637 RepID=UPI001C6BBEA5|nr:hypothetical protein J3458_001897 [Metarhizium acridum]
MPMLTHNGAPINPGGEFWEVFSRRVDTGGSQGEASHLSSPPSHVCMSMSFLTFDSMVLGKTEVSRSIAHHKPQAAPEAKCSGCHVSTRICLVCFLSHSCSGRHYLAAHPTT